VQLGFSLITEDLERGREGVRLSEGREVWEGTDIHVGKDNNMG
jgi:hypothetical protein